MAISVRCPNPACGKQHSIADGLAGKTVKCDACGRGFQVPVPAKPAGADAGTVLLGKASPPSVQSAIRPRSEISPPADNPQSAIQLVPFVPSVLLVL